MTEIISIFLHLDEVLATVVSQYGGLTYFLLFSIIFLETGLVVTPFLPGDSLLFAAGALAALGALDPIALFFLLTAAAVIGDAVNYAIGHSIGHALLERGKFLGLPMKREYFERAKSFYARYGGKAIVVARFMPIVRTFAPFVAGIGEMPYRRFFAYNVAGAVLWVGLFVAGGYYFGNIPAVKERFSLVVIAIVAISLLPIAIEFLKSRKRETQGQ